MTANAPTAAGAGARKDAELRSSTPTPVGGRPELNWIEGTNTATDVNTGLPIDDDDQLWSAAVNYTGLNPNLEVGYLNQDGQFFMVGNQVPAGDYDDQLTMPMNAQGEPVMGAVIGAFRSQHGHDVRLHNLRNGYSYSDINPNNSSTYLQADIGFDILSGPDAGIYDVSLDGLGQETTGGFTTVPEPPSAF